MEKEILPGKRRRAPVVNGIFYPDDREALTSHLASWGLREGSIETDYGNNQTEKDASGFGGQAILAPHGAWELTGNIAGRAFAAVQEREAKTGRSIARVLLFSNHHYPAEEGIYLSESASFGTPLGDLVVDGNLNRELASCSPRIKIYDIPHLSEHALEVLLPLVKYCFPGAKIVPILMSGTNNRLISDLAYALKTVLREHTEENLFVISSNVSQDPDPALALSMADTFRGLISDMDSRGFLSSLAGGRISACGSALIAALLESDLLHGKHFSSLCPMTQAAGENGETVYYSAFDCTPMEY